MGDDRDCQRIPKLQGWGRSCMWYQMKSLSQVAWKFHIHINIHKAMEQIHKCISDFKGNTRPADVGKDAFSQKAPGFKENKLLRSLCMPRWKTGLLGDEGTSQRMWCQECKVTWTSRGNKESGCSGWKDAFAIHGVWDERAEAGGHSPAASLGEEARQVLPHTVEAVVFQA